MSKHCLIRVRRITKSHIKRPELQKLKQRDLLKKNLMLIQKLQPNECHVIQVKSGSLEKAATQKLLNAALVIA